MLCSSQTCDFASLHTKSLAKRHHSLCREAAPGPAAPSWNRACKYSRQQLALCSIWVLILLSEILHVLVLMGVHGMGRRARPITGPTVMQQEET